MVAPGEILNPLGIITEKTGGSFSGSYSKAPEASAIRGKRSLSLTIPITRMASTTGAAVPPEARISDTARVTESPGNRGRLVLIISDILLSAIFAIMRMSGLFQVKDTRKIATQRHYVL